MDEMDDEVKGRERKAEMLVRAWFCVWVGIVYMATPRMGSARLECRCVCRVCAGTLPDKHACVYACARTQHAHAPS